MINETTFHTHVHNHTHRVVCVRVMKFTHIHHSSIGKLLFLPFNLIFSNFSAKFTPFFLEGKFQSNWISADILVAKLRSGAATHPRNPAGGHRGPPCAKPETPVQEGSSSSSCTTLFFSSKQHGRTWQQNPLHRGEIELGFFSFASQPELASRLRYTRGKPE